VRHPQAHQNTNRLEVQPLRGAFMKSFIHWLTHWPNLSWWWTKVQLKAPLLFHAMRGPRQDDWKAVNSYSLENVRYIESPPIDQEPAPAAEEPELDRKARDHMKAKGITDEYVQQVREKSTQQAES
jgi:hypothetical protein